MTTYPTKLEPYEALQQAMEEIELYRQTKKNSEDWLLRTTDKDTKKQLLEVIEDMNDRIAYIIPFLQ